MQLICFYVTKWRRDDHTVAGTRGPGILPNLNSSKWMYLCFQLGQRD